MGYILARVRNCSYLSGEEARELWGKGGESWGKVEGV